MKTLRLVGATDVEDPGDLDESTRQKVLSSLLSQGPRTAAALAEELGLTPAAIRRHLSALVGEGLLASREQRVYGPRGRGRPASVFVLTDEGRATFHHSYDEFAVSALDKLVEMNGAGAIEELAERWFAPVEKKFDMLRQMQPELTRVEALAMALNETGYMASVITGESGMQVCQHHCPLAYVAEKYPMMCAAETSLFSRLLDIHIQRLATIAHGDGVCTTHVPRPITREKSRS